MYKLISKVLTSRLRDVLDGVISESQNAFICRRQILDFSLVASECVDFRLSSGIPRVLCKLDIEKAFNHVNWSFLLYMLPYWRDWVLGRDEGGGSSSIFRLSDVSQLRCLRCVLVCFRAISGLKVNVGKSSLVLVGEVHDIANLAAVLGCRVSHFPISYLGLPLGSSLRRVRGWDLVIERIRDGKNTRLWKDLRCGERSLAYLFLRLLRIAIDKHAWVANCYRLDSGRITWDVRFRRLFHDWELDDVSNLLVTLY
ncbi:uncharacterized protein LOC132316541 [Cornus florida]|uniref:uncharacterized protein LOC132316541 n=1 Tax=Cornus florida TaxID=4283 RepID=UPI00289D1884|nr:uncharacterized protein LOC132316541 [Cornus florida]